MKPTKTITWGEVETNKDDYLGEMKAA